MPAVRRLPADRPVPPARSAIPALFLVVLAAAGCAQADPVPATQASSPASPAQAPAIERLAPIRALPATTAAPAPPTTEVPATTAAAAAARAPRTTRAPAATRPARTVPPPTVAAASTGCDPSYPDDCLDQPGDYDCAGGTGNGPNYVQGPLRVLAPDPFGLDDDGDGVGCER